eukprot:5111917-Pleurochrysis_carterae.AAC.5
MASSCLSAACSAAAPPGAAALPACLPAVFPPRKPPRAAANSASSAARSSRSSSSECASDCASGSSSSIALSASKSTRPPWCLPSPLRPLSPLAFCASRSADTSCDKTALPVHTSTLITADSDCLRGLSRRATSVASLAGAIALEVVRQCVSAYSEAFADVAPSASTASRRAPSSSSSRPPLESVSTATTCAAPGSTHVRARQSCADARRRMPARALETTC